MTLASSLQSFLGKAENSSSRELLLTSRLIHDLAIAAAARDYDLLFYTPTVDSDGFDLIIDDRDQLLPLQLKSVIRGGKAGYWSVHRRLLRPAFHEIETFGFEPSPCGEGRGGGVVLIDFRAEDKTVKVEYRYTDIRVLTALWLGLVKRPDPSRKRLNRLKRELGSEPSGKVEVPRSAFLRPKSPEHLLALMGMHSRYRTSWARLLFQLSRFKYEKIMPDSASPEKLREVIASDLSDLCLS